MAEFDITRIRYTWKGPWTTATSYKVDDIVIFQGSSYTCLRVHTSGNFNDDQSYLANPGDTLPSPAWSKTTNGFAWSGSWNASTVYGPGALVLYGGIIYVCIEGHTSSSTFAANNTKFSVFLSLYNFRNNWSENTRYGVNDLVKNGGIIYRCTVEHTSASFALGLEADQSKWAELYEGIEHKSDWVPYTKYVENDLVKYGGSLLRCISQHTSTTAIDSTKFQVEFPGFGSVGSNTINSYTIDVDHVGNAAYLIGSKNNPNIFLERGSTYTFNIDAVGHPFWIKTTFTTGSANAYNTGVTNNGTQFGTITFTVPLDAPAELYYVCEYHSPMQGRFYVGIEWSSHRYYAVGDLVLHGGWLYRANTNNFNKVPGDSLYQPTTIDWTLVSEGVNFKGDWSQLSDYKTGDIVRRGGYLYRAIVDTTNDGSTLDYVDSSNWELVVTGNFFRETWTEDQDYAIGDSVYFNGVYYSCVTSHTSSTQNFPGDNGSGIFYWNILIDTGIVAGMRIRGDLLTYDLSRTAVGDDSTLGPTRVPIGANRQLLSINEEGSIYYKHWGQHEKLVYVSSDDNVALDDVTDPTRGYSPFRPWRTVQYAAQQVEPLTEDGITQVCIKLSAGLFEEVLPIVIPTRVAVVGQEIRSTTVKAAPANPELQGDLAYRIDVLERIRSIINDILLGNPVSATSGNEELQVILLDETEYPITSSPLVVAQVQSLIDDFNQYINFHVGGNGTNPVMTGSNDEDLDQDSVQGRTILEANKNFIAAEAVAFLQTNFPSYTFNSHQYKNDIKRYVESWIYDLRYTGNYKTLMSARIYKNAVLGSELEDMFYVRNATGIKLMTVSGLSGELTSELLLKDKRPTGGAYVSLDPGWGPDDEKVWITTRSCYVKDVTTIGYAAVGQKIDGALHNGGNKSIITNDFTQVISDGIGSWVLNNGRSEQVSVFTYYAHFGIFTENGGVVRGLNCNSSYGNFGTYSKGNDDTEIPKYAHVNTRTQHAIVEDAFAGEVNDEVLILEYAHAGQNYKNATFTITSSGVGAVPVFEETRDNAIFQALIRALPGGGTSSPGGAGYFIKGNNAQEGNATSITIASNDESTPAELIGLRIILTSGPGTGQYGYVSTYDANTKIVTVRRESDGQLGWDHVIPGYGNVNLITTNTFYRFEPRPVFSDPGFTATTVDTGINLNWSNAVYGETYKTFTNVVGSLGTGFTIDVTPAPATWNIIKNGRSYIVSLVSGGAGYENGQTIVIDGSDIGGISEEHDIIITVKEISDDSTNSIVNYTFKGVAQSGLFVATPASTSTYLTSLDGVNWSNYSLPAAGNYNCLAWGENTFVTIASNTSTAYTSNDGVNWTARALGINRPWADLVYGDGIFVVISSTFDTARWSTNGITWNNTTLPDLGDSTSNTWVSITYGNGRFVAVANSNNASAVGVYNSNLGIITWTANVIDADDSTPKDWTSVTYGNGRFVVISSTGDVSYSFDGSTWITTSAGMPSQDGSTQMYWKKIKYAQGVFFAICDTGGRTIGSDPTLGPTNFAATSYDGIIWTSRTLSRSSSWTNLTFGNPDISVGDSTTFSNSTGMWIILPAAGQDEIVKVLTGARALGRVVVDSDTIAQIKLWEPGSGYLNTPTFTIIDPNNTIDAQVDLRLADGVLAQPAWTSRGSGYKTSTTFTTVTGDGFADIIPSGSFIYISGLTELPGPGAQIRIGNIEPFRTIITEEIESIDNGSITGYFRVSPILTLGNYVQHNTSVEIRTRYSQIRITGHDFLDVGTGNFVQTNYPDLYASGDYLTYPENEVLEEDGGRVFYTSTDQSGNFKTGELFGVEQATGIVTISADFFDLEGLTELALGGVRLGGSGTVIREFSTDTLFTADSNNVIPTQRAIKAYLANRLNLGGSDLLTASFVAGTIRVGPNLFSNTADLTINITERTNFPLGSGISGSWLALIMFTTNYGQ